MAVAGGTAPCLRLNLDREHGIIVIEHCENRLIRIQVDMVDPATGEVVLITKGKNKGKPRQKVIPTGACELDLTSAARKLADDQSVWIKADDRAGLARMMKQETIPRPLLRKHERVNS